MKSLLPSRRKPPPEKQQSILKSAPNGPPPPQDLINRLPTELILLIFQNFTNPADILSSLNVCRTWRSILLSPEIWNPLADHFAPGLAAHIRASSPSIDSQGEAFHSALLHQHLHLTGLFTNSTHHVVRLNLPSENSFFSLSKHLPVSAGGVHSLATVQGLDPSAEEDHVLRIKLYSHGRVAWWPEGWHLPYFAVIDDLRARTRRMYLFPGQVAGYNEGQLGWKTAMGACLFVMGQEGAGVCVWHLERDEMKKVVLDGAFDRCVVQGERLLFVGRRWAQVWIWTWESGVVKRVDVAGLGCYARGPVTMGGQVILGYPPNPRPAPKVGLRFRDTDVKLDFILHPTDVDVFFVVTWDEVDLVVHEIAGGKLAGRIVCPREHLAHRIMQRSRTVNTVHYLRYERCDSYGGYCLLTAWIGEEPVCDCEYPGSMGSVCFNVYTKTFSAFVHHCLYQRTPDTHLWDGLLAVEVTGCEESERSGIPRRYLKAVVMRLRPCGGERHFDPSLRIEEDSPFPVRSPTGVTELLAFSPFELHGIRPRPQSFYRMAYALEAGGGDKQISLTDLKSEWLNGDEKTMIYVFGREYTVWTFGDAAEAEKPDKKEGRAWRDRWRSVMGGSGRGTRE